MVMARWMVESLFFGGAMMKKFGLIWMVWFMFIPSYGQTSVSIEDPIVQMDIVVEPGPNTSQQQGTVLIALDVKKAPISCRNFLNYVEDHFYDGLIFHRMIADFMIQGGGYGPGMKEKVAKVAIINEATKDLKNIRGSIAMARTMEVDSATSQFFINFKDNGFLDHVDDSAQGYGYAVFGQVVSGLEWLESLQQLSTHRVSGFADVPARQILIKHVKILRGKAKQAALTSLAAISQSNPAQGLSDAPQASSGLTQTLSGQSADVVEN